MKRKSYNLLFQFFSYWSDKTHGAPFFVKYKLLFGTLLIGLVSTSAKAATKQTVNDTVPLRPVSTEVTCYRIAVTPTLQSNREVGIRGYVRDTEGEPIIGATIKSKKDSHKSAMADLDGMFTMNAAKEDTLEFSFIGYESLEIPMSQMQDDKVIVLTEDDGPRISCYIIVDSYDRFSKDDIYDKRAKRTEKRKTKLAYHEVDQAPVSPVGDLEKFTEWVQSEIRYSEQMRKDHVQGQVILSFAIDKKGELVDKKVIGRLTREADKESLRVLSLSGEWQPGLYKSRYIKTTVIITIHFDAK